VATDTVTEWEPGVPLYEHPYDSDDLDTRVVRPIFQVFEDHRDGCGVCAGTTLRSVDAMATYFGEVEDD
jgi:hypothetical protein